MQAIIGEETKKQILEFENSLPSVVIACVGGGSNAIGIFQSFIDENEIELIGVEAGGLGIESGKHAARFSDPKKGRVGILHGTKSYVLQDKYGQIEDTHSISAGLDYPAVGPQHAHLREINRAQYTSVTDQEALDAVDLLCREEGILPALESAHAIAYLNKMSCEDKIIIINLSGRGDKDVTQIMQKMGN